MLIFILLELPQLPVLSCNALWRDSIIQMGVYNDRCIYIVNIFKHNHILEVNYRTYVCLHTCLTLDTFTSHRHVRTHTHTLTFIKKHWVREQLQNYLLWVLINTSSRNIQEKPIFCVFHKLTETVSISATETRVMGKENTWNNICTYLTHYGRRQVCGYVRFASTIWCIWHNTRTHSNPPIVGCAYRVFDT